MCELRVFAINNMIVVNVSRIVLFSLVRFVSLLIVISMFTSSIHPPTAFPADVIGGND